MKYLIFIALVFSVITAYHWIQYKRSKYQEFEYYLYGETSSFIRNLCFLTLLISSVIGLLLTIFLGGELVGLFL